MFDITRILTPATTRTGVDAQSRKRAIEAASDLLASRHPDLSARTLFDALMNRERLGSTALGEGVAIPHCRAECGEILGAFLRLQTPVDWEAPDGDPVDLLFVLVVPPDEANAHLEVLASLARLFQDPESRRVLRTQTDDEALYRELISLVSSQVA